MARIEEPGTLLLDGFLGLASGSLVIRTYVVREAKPKAAVVSVRLGMSIRKAPIIMFHRRWRIVGAVMLPVLM